MKAVCISDTHGDHDNLYLSKYNCEFLIHSGDFTMHGTLKQIFQFCDWLDTLKQFKHKIVIAGNHEQYLDKKLVGEESAQLVVDRLKQSCHYLQNDTITLEGIKFYGSPLTQTNRNWAFGMNAEELEQQWKLIPNQVDILITHGPPFGILDVLHRDDKHIGNKGLTKKVFEIKPRYHIFGHIHECYGLKFINDIFFVNASSADLKHKIANLPIVIPIQKQLELY